MPANRITTTLYLYLPASWPAQLTATSWALFNDQGNCLQQGHSEPRHWPQAQRVEIILTGEQCLLTRLDLPKTARARTAEALSYALEEQLLGDAADEHVVLGKTLLPHDATAPAASPTPAANTEPTAVWLIRRQRLRTLLQALQALNIQPQQLYSELQLLPLPAAGWTLYLKPAGQASVLRTADEQGGTLDRQPTFADQPENPPLELQLALEAANDPASSAGPPPASIDVWISNGETARLLTHWQARLNISLNYRGEFRWQDQLHRRAKQKTSSKNGLPRNLLTAEFAAANHPGQGWSSLRPALNLAALILAIYTLFSLAHWSWLQHEQQDIRQQMSRIFRAAQPQAQTIVDPVLQMQRLYDRNLREHGQLTRSDFLPLLERASAQFPAQTRLQQLNYEDGRLELQLQLDSSQALTDLQTRLEQAGLQVAVRDQRPVAADSLAATTRLLVTLAVRSRS